MKKNLLIAVLLGGATAFSFSSCKKDSKSPTCRMITFTSSYDTSINNISYNSDGKISATSSTKSTLATTFAYSGNTIIATTTSGGAFSRKSIITINSDGLAANVRDENNASGTDWNNTVYEYSGKQLIKLTATSSASATPDVTTVTWSNGNILNATGTGTSQSFDYYTDKKYQPGDYLQVFQLLRGYEYIRNTNLLKSFLVGTTVNTFTYTFDNNGKITAMTQSDGTNTTNYTYQYQCN